MFDFFEDPMMLVKCKLPLKRNLGRPLSYLVGVTANVLTLWYYLTYNYYIGRAAGQLYT